MKCPSCGNANSETARFCIRCGTPIGTVSTGNSGTRDDLASSDFVYPRNPPLSVHICWLNLFLGGAAQMIHGQVAKGLAILGAMILSNLMLPAILAIAINIASVIDAYNLGKTLKSGKAVKKWDFFLS
jgi:TM2 domain-containing membrane protein YozV